MKLGKKPARHDDRTRRLAHYLAPDVAPAPPEANWLAAKRLGVMLNDRIGCCGLASPGHAIQCMTAANGVEFVPSDEAIERAYRDVGGYVPGDPSTDNGIVLLDGMNYWRRTGIDGHRIDLYVAIDLKNRELFKYAIAKFGGAILGLDLPESAKDEEVWRLRMGGGHGSPHPGTWGGHAVSAHAYRSEELAGAGVTVITWGAPLLLTWDFLDAYCDEAYAVVSPDWADADGAPSGFDLERLRADISEIAA